MGHRQSQRCLPQCLLKSLHSLILPSRWRREETFEEALWEASLGLSMQFQSPPMIPFLQESKRRLGRLLLRMDSLSPLPAVPDGRYTLTKEVLFISKWGIRP